MPGGYTRRYTDSIREKLRADALTGKGESMATIVNEQHGGGHDGKDDHAVAQGVFHVNDREGRVSAHGEELNGVTILSRVGLTAERYELFTVKNGHADKPVGPHQNVHVKPGDHFRATLKGTDYSFPTGAV